MKTLGALALGTVLVVPAAALAAQPANEAAPAASLAGKWTLNKEESEDARAKMAEARGRRRGDAAGGKVGGGGHSGGGFGGHGGGFGGRGGGFGGQGHGQDGGGGNPDAPHGGTMRSFIEPPQTLTITQTAEEVGVDDGQLVLHLHPDGRKIKSEGGGAETITKWRGDELVVESKSERGARITTAYMAVPEKHQLDITSTMEGHSGDPITVRRVYDAAPAESGQ